MIPKKKIVKSMSLLFLLSTQLMNSLDSHTESLDIKMIYLDIQMVYLGTRIRQTV